MGRGFTELYISTVVGAFLIGTFLLLAVILSPLILIGVPAYVGTRLYLQSPARLERLAREETELLYRHALSGTAQLTDEEINCALAQHWPTDTRTT